MDKRYLKYIFCLTCLFSFGLQKEIDAQVKTCAFTTAPKRAEFKKMLVSTIEGIKTNPLSIETVDKWKSALWSMQLLKYTSPELQKILTDNFTKIFNEETNSIQRNYVEAIYSLYPKDFALIIKENIEKFTSTKAQSTALMYLKNNGIKINTEFIVRRLKNDTALTSSDSSRLLIAIDEYTNKTKQPKLPLKCIDKNYLKGKTLVISFQRSNRQYAGLTIVRDTAGNYYKENGTIVGVPQLARAITNLPYFITNGNTPQGLFYMNGLAISENKFIGPTYNIQLSLPVNETNLNDFSFGKQQGEFTLTAYQSLLPKALQNYVPALQTFKSGTVDRTEIIAHGTTVDTEYHKGSTYYPQTPTAGCLCTIELWDDKGNLIKSDQQKLVDAVKNSGGAYGYFLVIDINNDNKPVTLANVLPYIVQ